MHVYTFAYIKIPIDYKIDQVHMKRARKPFE